MFDRVDAPDHVIAVRLSGRITGEEMRRYRNLVNEALDGSERIGLFVDLADVEDLEGSGIFEGMRADLAILRNVSRIGRCALVSDKRWVQAIPRTVRRLLPTFQIEVFAVDARDAALHWAAELPPASEVRPAALRWLDTSRDDVLAFELDGTVTSHEMPAMVRQVEAFLDSHDHVRMLARIRRFEGVEPGVFLQRGLFPMKLGAWRKLERYALVGAPGWMRAAAERMGPLIPRVEIRAFSLEQESDAWEWLGATPSGASDAPTA